VKKPGPRSDGGPTSGDTRWWVELPVSGDVTGDKTLVRAGRTAPTVPRLGRRRACALLATAATTTTGCLGSLTTTRVRVEWGRAAGRADLVRDALHEAGLPDDVEVSVGGSFLGDNQRMFEDAVRNGDPDPELLVSGGGTGGETLRLLARRRDLPDLRSVVGPSLGEDAFRMGRAAMTVDGGLVGLPLFAIPSVVAYRQDWVADADYPVADWDDDPPDWPTFAQALRDVRAERGVAGFLFDTGGGDYPGGLFHDLLAGYGGAYFGDPSQYLFGPTGERPVTVDGPAAVAAGRHLQALVGSGDKAFAGLGPDGAVSAEDALGRVATGDAVACRTLASGLGTLGRPALERVGVTRVPRLPGVDDPLPWTGGPSSSYFGQYAVLNPNATGGPREGAAAVLRAMATETFQRRLFEAGLGDNWHEWFPARRSAYPRDTADEDDLRQFARPIRDANEAGITTPVTPAWSEQYRAIDDSLSGVVAGERDPEPALASLAEELRRIEGSE
jgi:ABC-type glycerol-3-phosphate transport system substrate-binding protein